MTALATSPAVIDLYLREQIADEVALANLLGYGNVKPDANITPNCWVWGTSKGERSLQARLATSPLPRWRRDNAAFELIGRCLLTISCGPTGVSAQSWSHYTACATVYTDHPTPDAAIRYVVCKAAIASLMLSVRHE